MAGLPLVAADTPTFEPRYYQDEAREAVVEQWGISTGTEAWANGQAPMVVMCTGAGKTLTFLRIAVEDCIAKGGRVVMLAHREELLDQPLVDVKRFWPWVSAGIVQADRNAVGGDMIFASVDTLRNSDRLHAILHAGPVDMIIVDECHRSMSPTHQNAITGLCGDDTKILGVTATPDREDGKDLGAHWEIVYNYDLVRGVADAVQVPPYAVHVPIDFDLEGVNVDDDEELGNALLEQGIVPHTVEAMQKTHLCERLPDRDDQRYLDARIRTTLVYTASVKQARLTADALNKAGILARWVCGSTPKSERRKLITAFKAGRIQALCNPSILTEGTNMPVADAALLARPLRSWSLFVQCVGRPGRPWAGTLPAWAGAEQGAKTESMLIDLSGSTKIHSIAVAPVLIGGSRCKKSPNSMHNYVAKDKGPKGECTYCKKTVACFARLGPHEWVDRDDGMRVCKDCESPQCSDAHDGRHEWVPFQGASRICIECGMEIADIHAGLLKPMPREQCAKAEFLRIKGLTPESFIIDTREHGMLLVVGDSKKDEWMAYWQKKGSPKARPLSNAPIPTDMVRTYADCIARRSNKYSGQNPVSKGQREYAKRLGVNLAWADNTGEAERMLSRMKGRKKLIHLGLAQPTKP